MNGIFNQELAELMREVCHAQVLYLEFNQSIKEIEIQQNKISETFTETIVYLPLRRNFIWKQRTWFKALNEAFDLIQSQGFKVDLMHVQVVWKMGLAAWFLNRKYKTPYIVTEHYTGYLKLDGALKGWKKWASKTLLQKANQVTAVSESLADALKLLTGKNVEAIPNPLHPIFFTHPLELKINSGKFRFIHISNMELRQKQTDKIIHAFAEIYEKNPHIELVLVVPKIAYNHFLKLNATLNMDGVVQIEPGMDREAYADLLASSNATISYSVFETFGLTVAEALCLGVPAIVSQSGGPEAFVNPENGILVDANDLLSLKLAMEQMVSKYTYKKEVIATAARIQFSTDKVVLAYQKIYQKILK